MKTTEFITGFQKNDLNDWKQKLLKEIKLEEYAQAIQKDRNGIEIHPIYVNTEKKSLATYRNNDEWWITNPYFIQNKNEKEINQKILHDLNDGVSGIQLIILQENVDVQTLLKEIDTDAIMICVRVNEEYEVAISDFEKYFLEKKNTQQGNIHFDSSSIYHIFQNQLFINGVIYNNSGANTITELSSIVSQLNYALHKCSEKNILHEIQTISISIAVDTNYFEQISKLRALRALIESIQLAYSIEIPIYIHANTSKIYLTQRDYNNNLIRNTIAGMSAIIGGADSLCIIPHDFYVSESYHFSDVRLGKNQQLLFKEESNLASVLNAGDGGYFIENYTEKLIEAAYSLFQKNEANGGWNFIKDAILHSILTDRKTLIDFYKEKKKILIGVNKYPNSNEVIEVKPVELENWQGIQAINLELEISK